MTTGHFGLALGVKSKARTVPLWLLMISTYLLDFIFIILASFGIESFKPINPAHPSYGAVIIHAYYSHSLAGALLISIIAGFIVKLIWNNKTGLVISIVVFSHWILDLIVHRPDLPILPGNAGNLPLLGFGLWKIPAVSAILELVIVGVSVYFYYRSAVNSLDKSNKNKTQVYLAVGTSGLLLLALLTSDFMGFSLNLGILIMLLLIVLCGWLDSRLNWKVS